VFIPNVQFAQISEGQTLVDCI